VSIRFAYFYLMADDPARIRSVAARHTEHWHSLHLKEYQGGPLADRSGGLITFVVDLPAEADAAVAGDPFVRQHLLERYWLREWQPVDPDSASSKPSGTTVTLPPGL
jgi:uncharacterized protein YciI